MEKMALTGLTPSEIVKELNISQKFRGLQIFKWIGSGIQDFDQMTNLPKDFRKELSEKSRLRCTKISKTLKDPDGTVKLQIELNDNRAVETVLLIDKEGRKTACVSCQAGCPMGCAFCQTGQLGLGRNLTAAEIVEQFLHLECEAGKLNNIVFMGMGEPMLNLNEIRKAIAILTDKRGRNLSARRITLSTSGIVKGIYDLADNGPNIRLAVSLTTADEELRSEIMPVNKTNPLSELKKAIDYYATKTGKRVTLEAALLKDKNTSIESASRMVEFAKDIDVHVNIIPWNPVSTLPFQEPTLNEVNNFIKYLENNGINVTLRKKRGRKIGGACGQLGKSMTSQNNN